MAEREGFEPPVPAKVRLISSQVHSTGLCHLSVSPVYRECAQGKRGYENDMALAAQELYTANPNLRRDTTARANIPVLSMSNVPGSGVTAGAGSLYIVSAKASMLI